MVSTSKTTESEGLLKRAFIFLEDGDFIRADEYCEKVLDLDPENAYAYLGKLMAELKVNIKDNLQNCTTPFEKKDNYKKIIRFADKTLTEEITSYLNIIKERIQQEEENRRQQLYNKWISLIETTTEFTSLLSYQKELSDMTNFKYSKQLADKCIERIYNLAKNSMNNARLEADYRYTAEIFSSILYYRDSKQLKEDCENLAQLAVDRKIKDQKIVELNIELERLSKKLDQSNSQYAEANKKIFAGKALKEAQANIDYYTKEIKKIEEKIKDLER